MAKKAKKYRADTYINKRYPGLPGYTGPQKGWFAFLHHGILFEEAEYAGVNERVEYVRRHKPTDEREVRLRCIMYLPPALQAYLDRHGHHSTARAKVLAWVNKVNPTHTWKDNSLHKANGSRMTG